MSIEIDDELFSGLTYTLDKDEIRYVKVNGVISNCLASIKIVDSGSQVTIQTALESQEYILSHDHADVLWKDLTSNPITSDVQSQAFVAPSIIYIKNTTATSSHRVRVSFRANRA